MIKNYCVNIFLMLEYLGCIIIYGFNFDEYKEFVKKRLLNVEVVLFE